MLLAGLVCYQIARLITHKNPLDDLKIPPSAFASTSQPATQPKSTNSATAKPTNSVSTQATNSTNNVTNRGGG